MICSCSNHDDLLSQEHFNEYRLVFIVSLSLTQTKLSLGSLSANVNMPFVSFEERMVAPK